MEVGCQLHAPAALTRGAHLTEVCTRRHFYQLLVLRYNLFEN
jgi:hypothetical protein